MTYTKVKDLKGKRITVMGLGIHGGGIGTAKFLARAGAKVLVTDIKKGKDLKTSLKALEGLPIKYVLGRHRKEDFINCDLVIKSPAVSETSKYLEEARINNVEIETDVGLFFKLAPSRLNLIGITGTKGKSTTTALAYEILNRIYKDVVLAGNIGVSLLEKLSQIKKNTLVVMELSSWQLEGLRKYRISPHVSVVLNVMPDHLNRYKNINGYVEAKKLIFAFQKPEDILILNYDNNITRGFAREARGKGKVFFFTHAAGMISNRYLIGAYVKEGKILFNQKEICRVGDIKIPGWHNVSNVLAAATLGMVYRVSPRSIKKTISNFKGIKHRLEFIKEIKGVKFYNDTTATTPEATIAALNSFPLNLYKNRIVLIAGGTDKNLDYSELAKEMTHKVKALILLEGSASKKIEQSIRKDLSVEKANNMEEAVKLADLKATIGDIVLLSPASASFEMFKHEFDRGEKFVKAINKLINQ